MPNVNIEDKLYLDIKEYCRLNKLTISVFVNDLLRKGFMVEKYDDAPPFFKKKNESSEVSATTPSTEKVTISYEAMDRIREALSPEQFELEATGRFEPEKKKEYVSQKEGIEGFQVIGCSLWCGVRFGSGGVKSPLQH